MIGDIFIFTRPRNPVVDAHRNQLHCRLRFFDAAIFQKAESTVSTVDYGYLNIHNRMGWQLL